MIGKYAIFIEYLDNHIKAENAVQFASSKFLFYRFLLSLQLDIIFNLPQ